MNHKRSAGIRTDAMRKILFPAMALQSKNAGVCMRQAGLASKS